MASGHTYIESLGGIEGRELTFCLWSASAPWVQDDEHWLEATEPPPAVELPSPSPHLPSPPPPSAPTASPALEVESGPSSLLFCPLKEQ